jgi:hypothetical protein
LIRGAAAALSKANIAEGIFAPNAFGSSQNAQFKYALTNIELSLSYCGKSMTTTS